jgi:type VI secretion system protein ImpG
MFNKYYQDELVYLREMGREFAAAYPESARFLAEPGSDPDVERMLEGFAFLTGKLRQKLDDELPELTHSLMQMLAPHYLRPVPAATVIQFEHANKAAAELKQLKRGIEIDSVPVDGTRCRFRTCYDFEMAPLELREVELRREAPPRLRLTLEAAGKIPLHKNGVRRLRFYLSGEAAISRGLYVSLLRHLRRVVVSAGDSRRYELPADRLRAVGFADDEAVLSGPGASFQGFRLLQEYFAFPAKFMFVELDGLDGLAGFEGETRFTLDFEFNRLPDAMPPVSRGNVLLNCVPAVNLLRHDADPIRLQRGRTEYTLRPSGKDPRHYEVFSVDRVRGLEVGTAREIEFRPQFNMTRRRDDLFYHTRRQQAVAGDGSEVLLSFVGDAALHAAGAHGGRESIETVSVELTCTNAQLPSRLDAGDISVKTPSSPIFAQYRNLFRPTPTVPPPLGDDLHWRLISHLTLNYTSLMSVEALRAMVGLYNFRARIDRQTEQAHARLLEGITQIGAKAASRLLDGFPVRGLEVDLTLDEELIGGEGELYLFASVLNEFFAQYVTLNSYSRLKVTGARQGEIFQWPARIGKRVIL